MRESWHASRIEKPKEYWREEHLDPDPTFRTRKCLEISGAKRREIEVDVAVEVNVNINLNGGCVTVLPALPAQLKEMAVGFLIGEGLVESFEDISSVKEENGALVCETKDGKAAPWKGHQCCSLGGDYNQNLKQIDSKIRMKASALLSAVDQLNESARLWRRTGATHIYVMLMDRSWHPARM